AHALVEYIGLAYLLRCAPAVLAILTYFSTLRWLCAGGAQRSCDADGLVTEVSGKPALPLTPWIARPKILLPFTLD
ncbi:MAG: hypothetical protein ABN490_13785, partial [Pantoea agglomerans]